MDVPFGSTCGSSPILTVSDLNNNTFNSPVKNSSAQWVKICVIDMTNYVNKQNGTVNCEFKIKNKNFTQYPIDILLSLSCSKVNGVATENYMIKSFAYNYNIGAQIEMRWIDSNQHIGLYAQIYDNNDALMCVCNYAYISYGQIIKEIFQNNFVYWSKASSLLASADGGTSLTKIMINLPKVKMCYQFNDIALTGSGGTIPTFTNLTAQSIYKNNGDWTDLTIPYYGVYKITLSQAILGTITNSPNNQAISIIGLNGATLLNNLNMLSSTATRYNVLHTQYVGLLHAGDVIDAKIGINQSSGLNLTGALSNMTIEEM